tara:strand:- start:1170 stop:1616 length:447 start_codon:yes stop_codon:yes gene_type:complete
MAGITLKIKNLPQFSSKLNMQSKNVNRNIIQVVNSIANSVRNTAVVSIIQNSRAGGQVTRYNPTRTINISKAGDPPAADTGYLSSQIVVKIDATGLGADIISNADYSAALEYGTLKMPARPFMQPAAEENRKKFDKKMAQAVNNGLKS